MGRKTGLLLANVYQGASRAMWRYAAALSARHPDDSLILIPGGRLGFLGASEYLRNSIYDLVSSLSIDGAMIWSSSLTGAENAESIMSFVRGIAEHLPVVSMCMTIPGIPSVDFDAYTGTYSAVMHFVKDHGFSRIAFIRGPANHGSAEARYRAYIDALSDAGIKTDSRLITSPRPWSEGAAAAQELISERRLKAREDFQAVVAASDLLILGAEPVFREAGISIPEDIGISGFNDNEENQLLDVELTTVRMPIRRILETSYSVLEDLVTDKDSAVPSLVLPSDFIIRRSCGCSDSLGGHDKAKELLRDEDELNRWLEEYLHDDEAYKALSEILDYIFSSPSDDSRAVTCAVSRYFDSGADASTILEAVRWSEDILGKKERSAGRRDYVLSRIAHGSRRLYAREQQRIGEVSRILDTFKASLLAARSYSSLPLIMQNVFPSLGISGALLMLYEDFHYTKMLGGFSGDKLFSENVRFPRSRMVPEALSSFLDKGTFVIEPLYYENQELGYILIATPWCESHVLEDIRASLSSAIRGISLTEVAQKAAEAAEEGERKAGEFYASVSEALRGPLSAMRRLLARNGRLPRAEIADEVKKAEQMLSLSLAEFGDLNLEKTLVPISSLAEDLRTSLGADITMYDDMPALEIDEERIAELVSMVSTLINPFSPPVLTISLFLGGVEIRIKGSSENCASEPAWQLASRIAVLHSGEIKADRNGAVLIIPYPTLSGHQGAPDGKGPLVWLSSDNLPGALAALSPLVVQGGDINDIYHMQPRPIAIAWRKSGVTGTGAAVLRILRSHRFSRSLPFLAFGIEQKAASLAVALECDRADADDSVIYMSAHLPFLEPVLSDFGRIEDGILPEEILLRSNGKPRLIVLSIAENGIIYALRSSKRYSSVPILIVKDLFTSEEIGGIIDVPNIIIANAPVLEAPDFTERLVSILTGGEILPPLTGALVKRAIVFLNRHLAKQISRWQLAESVNISEDYLTRIFRREMGVSPWDYLTRCRVGVASDLLRRTGAPLSEIAQASGFQDQAYFNRVFRKIKGCTPGHYRQSD